MRYHNITKDDMLNGDGLRVVLWVAGCNHACAGCQNPVTWDPEGGLPFDSEAEEELNAELGKDYISGITLSGGDPLYPDNREAVEALIARLRTAFPQKTIWLYTGYRWEEIQTLSLLSGVDVLVDGRFQRECQDNTLYWRGSKNQRVIDVKKSLETGAVVLHTSA